MRIECLIGPEVDSKVVDVGGGEKVSCGGEGQASGGRVHQEDVNHPKPEKNVMIENCHH